MMKILKFGKYFAFLCAVLSMLMQGCQKEEDNPHEAVNNWIHENMQIYYLWNTELPKNAIKSQSPDDYFRSLLHGNDRFSVIHNNFSELLASLSGVNTEAGYDYVLLRISETDIIGYITYIKPKTPAEAAELKRGDIFMQINDTQITTDNYRTLMPQTRQQHTLGKLVPSGNTYSIQNVSLSVIMYEENPILLDTVYYFPEKNKKIGYFVYNFFARDSNDSGIEYERQMNNIFGNFITEGINELIVDLRYNSGGTISTALSLASMISGRNSNDVFGFEEFNSLVDSEWRRRYGDDYNVMMFPDDIVRVHSRGAEVVSINKLSGLNRVYFIVSSLTASSSEMLINGLRPYMGAENVILVGENTFGKNVGSFVIYETDEEKQKTNNWGMLPIVLKLSNKDGFSDYGNGFAPDVEAYEMDDLFDMKPLGDTEEWLLAITLGEIFGIPRVDRKNIGERYQIVGSAIDRTPARKNMFMYDRKNSLFGRD